jgi:hypothetical protein
MNKKVIRHADNADLTENVAFETPSFLLNLRKTPRERGLNPFNPRETNKVCRF